MSSGTKEMGLLHSLQRKPGWSWQEVNDNLWETRTLPQPGGGGGLKTTKSVETLFLSERGRVGSAVTKH